MRRSDPDGKASDPRRLPVRNLLGLALAGGGIVTACRSGRSFRFDLAGAGETPFSVLVIEAGEDAPGLLSFPVPLAAPEGYLVFPAGEGLSVADPATGDPPGGPAMGDGAFLRTLAAGRPVRDFLDCVQLHLPDSVPLPEPPGPIRPLDPRWAGHVHAHYTRGDLLDTDHLARRIRSGPALAWMEDGLPVGWILTHEEGTMGVLEVLPSNRRRGIGQALLQAMCRRIRQDGGMPVAHVGRDNPASLGLCRRIGMREDCRVAWYLLGQPSGGPCGGPASER